MPKHAMKIIGALVIAFTITFLLTRTFFVTNTPRPNKKLITSIPARFISFIKTLSISQKKPTPVVEIQTIPSPPPNENQNSITPTVKLSLSLSKSPTPFSQSTHSPTISSPTKIPTLIIKPPSIKPSFTPASNGGTCPTTSNQNYSSMPAEHNPSDLLIGPADQSPEINLRLRGFVEVNEGTGFIGRNGSTYGLDDQMPPQISSLFGGVSPKIIKTYRVYDWDFDNKKSLAPQTASQNYKVHMLGLQGTPRQPLLGLKAGRSIGGGNVFMTLYATKTDIAFTHSPSDTLMGGYLFFFLDICVDPNLLAAYESANASGRSQLPVIATGQTFGYASNSDIKVVVRDTMSFMDTRYNEDWWTYGN
ncbi:hypothetical protein HY041_04345 [Candidatus Roizmanbacteria bacterium]|nr:hypothetical protein [Candidatus Roizmanbacteria bacterium]